MSLFANFQKYIQDEEREEQKVRKESKYVTSVRKIKGLKVWGFDTTLEFSPDKIEEIVIQSKVKLDLEQNPISESKAFIKPNVIVVQALNHKNAVRKIKKILNQHKL